MFFNYKSISLSKSTLFFIIVSVAFFVHVTVFYGIWKNYQPWFDNIPVIVYSTPISGMSWTQWFLDGYSNYFESGSELPSSGAPFVRPGVNFVFNIIYIIFGKTWFWYLLVNYLLLAIGIGLSWYLLAISLRLNLIMTLIGLSAISVAEAVQMAWLHPSYITDILAGVLIICSFLSSRGTKLGNTVCATIFMLMAVSAKETAIVGVIAFVIQTFFRFLSHKRNGFIHIFISCMPILLWLFFRFVGPDPTQAYPIVNLKEWNFFDALISWPTLSLSGLTKERAGIGCIILFFINVMIVVVLSRFGIVKLSNTKRSKISNFDRPGDVYELALWCSVWIALLLFLPPQGRHGYGLVLLGIPLVCYEISKINNRFCKVGCLFIFMILIMIPARTAGMLSYQGFKTGTFQGRYAISRNLIEQLQIADKDQCSTIFILHNVVEYGSSQALRLFAGVKTKIVNLSILDGNIGASRLDQNAFTEITNTDTSILIHTKIPSKLHFVFPQSSEKIFKRNGDIGYAFIDAKNIGDMGVLSTIRMRRPIDKIDLLVFDFNTGRYKLLKF